MGIENNKFYLHHTKAKLADMFSKMALRGFSEKAGRVRLKHLPYEIGALEPVVSGHLLDFHYGKHHRTYVNNLNNLLEQ